MAQAARKHDTATYADLLQLPEHLTGKIINGELHTPPRHSPCTGILRAIRQSIPSV